MSITQAKIDFWINNNQNVMFVGRHGVGKTAMVTEAFNRHNLNWRYFSASTMDPWCDFIGVPKERTERPFCEQMKLLHQIASVNPSAAIAFVQNNWKIEDKKQATELVNHALKGEGNTHLELVRPVDFANDEVEALFFDEFNRSPKKVRNAVMELIQFKSINGKKFPNLRFIWCAINPDDDEQLKYDVESLDSAQIDRFQISVPIPYRPNADWFRQKYGNYAADAAIQWWDELEPDFKNSVSPRRLQYALDCYMAKGDPRDVLPAKSNVAKLISVLKSGPIAEQLQELIRKQDVEASKKFLQNENNFASAINYIMKADSLLDFFGPLMPTEKISSIMSTDDKFCSHVVKLLDKVPAFHRVCKDILKANLDASLTKKIRRVLTENDHLQKAFAKDSIEAPDQVEAPFFNANKTAKNYKVLLSAVANKPTDNIQQKIAAYQEIQQNIPELLDFESASTTLAVIQKIIVGNAVSVANTQIQNQFQNLYGVINHCLIRIYNFHGSTLPDLSHEQSSLHELIKAIVACGGINKIVKSALKS